MDKISLVRAFTTRRTRSKPEMHIALPGQLGRAASQRAGKPVDRSQISGPVALVSTTNMLSYEAPDLPGNASSASSSAGEDSDASALSIDTNDITDASSIEYSPVSPGLEPNHLSCYFKPAVDTKPTASSRSPSLASSATFDAPAIPKRVPSHSKKAHEHLHRKRSIQRMMSPPASIIRNSADMFAASRSLFVDAPKESPFGPELAQLDEVAEELGSVFRDAEAQADQEAFELHNLAYFSAPEYLSEIQSLIRGTFSSDAAPWI